MRDVSLVRRRASARGSETPRFLLSTFFCKLIAERNVRSTILNSFQMPQTVPTAAGYSPSFDYSTFQFDLSLLPDDYSLPGGQIGLKSSQIKQEARSPRPGSPTTHQSPPYQNGELPLSPNYSHEGSSPGYPTSPYYVPRSPQSAQFYPTSPEPSAKQPVKREKSLDLLAILQESRYIFRARKLYRAIYLCIAYLIPPLAAR